MGILQELFGLDDYPKHGDYSLEAVKKRIAFIESLPGMPEWRCQECGYCSDTRKEESKPKICPRCKYPPDGDEGDRYCTKCANQTNIHQCESCGAKTSRIQTKEHKVAQQKLNEQIV